MDFSDTFIQNLGLGLMRAKVFTANSREGMTAISLDFINFAGIISSNEIPYVGLPFLKLSAAQAPFATAATVEIGFFSPANTLPHRITIGMACTKAILTRELLKGIPWESEFEGRKTDEMEKCYFLFPPSDHGLDLMSGEISSMAKPLVLQTRLQVARPFLPEDGEEMKSCSGAAGGLMEKQICKSLFHPYWSSVGRIVMTVRCQIFFASG